MKTRKRAFSIIELLVVVGVIGLLISAIVIVAGPAIHAQKSANTKQTMQTVLRAIDQFSAENPLRAIYDTKDAATFGSLPPYQLHRYGGSVNSWETPSAAPGIDWMTRAVEDPLAIGVPSYPAGWQKYRLAQRLWRDIGGGTKKIDDWVRFGGTGDPQPNEGDSNDDNRGLVTYLKVFSPNLFNQIPQNALRPLNPKAPDLVDPRGSKIAPGGKDATWVDIPGIHDAWGVPLDYFMYVKMEWTTPPGGVPGFRVVERVPVLRSRGVDREIYDTAVRSARSGGLIVTDRARSIYSSPIGRPFAQLKDGKKGEINSSMTPRGQANGWLRAAAAWDDYGYLPDLDGQR